MVFDDYSPFLFILYRFLHPCVDLSHQQQDQQFLKATLEVGFGVTVVRRDSVCFMLNACMDPLDTLYL